MKRVLLALFGLFGAAGLLSDQAEIQTVGSAVVPDSSDAAAQRGSAIDSLIDGVDVDRFQKEHVLLVATNHVS